MPAKRHRIALSDREIAGRLLMRLAHHPIQHCDRFALDFYYDYDADFLTALAKDLELPRNFPSKSYLNRLRKICRHLERYDILYGRVASCHADSYGEPKVLKQYSFAEPSYAWRLAPELHTHYKPMGNPKFELSFLLRSYGEEEYGTI